MRFVLFALLISLAVGCSKQDAKNVAPSEKKDVSGPETTPAGKYPYPECETILKALKNAAGEPASVEVIDWGKPEPTEKGKIVGIRFRAKNKLGAMAVQEMGVSITKDGKIQGSGGFNPGDPIDPLMVKN